MKKEHQPGKGSCSALSLLKTERVKGQKQSRRHHGNPRNDFRLVWFFFLLVLVLEKSSRGSITILQGEKRSGRNAVFTTAPIGVDMPIPWSIGWKEPRSEIHEELITPPCPIDSSDFSYPTWALLPLAKYIHAVTQPATNHVVFVPPRLHIHVAVYKSEAHTRLFAEVSSTLCLIFPYLLCLPCFDFSHLFFTFYLYLPLLDFSYLLSVLPTTSYLF